MHNFRCRPGYQRTISQNNGFVLTLDSDGRLFCRACPEKAKSLFNPIEVVSEPIPTDEEGEEIKHEQYLEHMAEILIDEMHQITE
jgi:hypothetical protein